MAAPYTHMSVLDVERSFKADEAGMEILAFGPRRADDQGEVVQGWWSD